MFYFYPLSIIITGFFLILYGAFVYRLPASTAVCLTLQTGERVDFTQSKALTSFSFSYTSEVFIY